MEKCVRFGVIGYGVQGSFYASVLSEKPFGCCLAAISTTDPAKGERIRQAYPGVLLYADWKDMITSGVVDAVVITVPHFLHHEIAIFALEHGVHTLVEKPAGIRAKDVQAMNDCAGAHPQVRFGIMFNQRTNPLYQRVRALVSSGELGQLRRSVWIINTWWRPDSYYQQSPWRATWGGEGGGVLVNQAPHQLDLWQWICGMPTRLVAWNLEGAHREIAVENDVTILAEYENGAAGVFITCTHDPLGTDRLEIDLSGGKIVVENSAKATVYRLKKPEEVLNATMTMETMARLAYGTPAELYDVEEFTHRDDWGAPHAAVFENFAKSILAGGELLAPGAEGIRSVEIANAAQLSGWTGGWVAVPVDPEQYAAALNEKIKAEGKFPLRT